MNLLRIRVSAWVMSIKHSIISWLIRHHLLWSLTNFRLSIIRDLRQSVKTDQSQKMPKSAPKPVNNKPHEEIIFSPSFSTRSLIFNARIKIPQQHQPTNISITFRVVFREALWSCTWCCLFSCGERCSFDIQKSIWEAARNVVGF